jgi:hypothetical protein
MVRALLAGAKTQTRRLVASPTHSRFGAVGDVLYVRERIHLSPQGHVTYLADLPVDTAPTLRFRPAIFMPRRCARLFIQIAALRTESLQQITPPDALAEGCPPEHRHAPIDWYRALWNSLDPAPGTRWTDDPKVHVITFEQAWP